MVEVVCTSELCGGQQVTQVLHVAGSLDGQQRVLDIQQQLAQQLHLPHQEDVEASETTDLFNLVQNKLLSVVDKGKDHYKVSVWRCYCGVASFSPDA